MYLRNPRIIYALGGSLKDGKIDCSEFVRQCALPFLKGKAKTQRTQAWRIYRGLDGFDSKPVDWMRDNEVADLLCLRVPGSLNRPYGINHVGAVILWRGNFAIIDANSRTKGIRIGPFQGIWKKYLPPDGYRRLTIGDK